MSIGKLKKFSDLKTFTNVFQPDIKSPEESFVLKGKWAKEHFKNENPLVLELACGKGEYSVALAKANPNKNFIGIDIKGARIWAGSKYALENNLTNVAFLRIEIEKILNFFAPNEIDEIWITFPDPQPNKPRTKKRLTSPRFLQLYKQIIKPGSIIHLKTDNHPLFLYTKEVIDEYKYTVNTDIDDLYARENIDPILAVKTYYEQMFLDKGAKIHYLQFKIN